MRPFPARYSGSGCTCIRAHTHTHTRIRAAAAILRASYVHNSLFQRQLSASMKKKRSAAESERQVLSAYNTSSSSALQEQAKKSAQCVYALIHKTVVVSQFVQSALRSAPTSL
uniref:Uncharacterized protein n=1 Tax=Trichogramma kaykai TaxID=54128 RepID=A0ABD2W501_9HYME